MLYDDMIWVWQAIIGNYGSFFALLNQPPPPPPPSALKTQKPEFWKKKVMNWFAILGYVLPF